MPPAEATDSFYLDTLTEVGPLGFILFFVFCGGCGADRALRNERRCGRPQTAAGRDGRGLASLSIQNFADDTLAHHAVSVMLWLFAALIITAARQIRAETRTSR